MLYFWYLSTLHEILLLEYFSCEWFQLLLTSHSNTMSLLLLRWNFWVLLATLIETDVRIKYSSDVYLSKCTSLHSSTIIHCTCFRINQQLAAVDSWWWYFGGGCASCASLRAAASLQTRSPAASREPNQDQIPLCSRWSSSAFLVAGFLFGFLPLPPRCASVRSGNKPAASRRVATLTCSDDQWV